MNQGNDNLIVGYCDYYASMRSHFQWIMDNGQLSTIHYQLSIKRRSLFIELVKGDRSSTHHIPTKIQENPSRLLWCLVNFRVDVVFGE
jgi:hypothetical protein